jgi:hypothetical protein
MDISKPSSKKQTFAVLALLLSLLAACAPQAAPPPRPTGTPSPPLFEITYCDIDPSNICLEGFGLNIDEGLLVLFKATDPLYEDIYIRADGSDGENLFECRHSAQFPENIYCLGNPVDEKELIKLNIYSNDSNKPLAIGVFNVQYTDLPEPDVEFGVEATPTPSPAPSSPSPSYPNPDDANPSYPNPTSAP